MSSQQKSRRSFLIDSVSGMGGAGSRPTTPPSLRPKSSCSRVPKRRSRRRAGRS